MLTKYDIELIEVASTIVSANSEKAVLNEEKTTDTASLEALFK